MFERIIIVEANSQKDENLEVKVGQECEGPEACVVWDAALVLAHFLQKHRQTLRLGQGKRVLELGAGTGAVGLVASALG